MAYNPKTHHRKSIRLKGYDYSQAGAYFITICCGNMECRFGEIENDQMILNEYGTIAYDEWTKLPERFSNFQLDVFQIMPNHMHAIIVLTDAVRAPLVGARENGARRHFRAGASPAPTTPMGDIAGAYKSLVANACLDIYKMKNETMGKLWHRNFYEHIIRNEKSYQTIANYIINNPANWKQDKFYRPLYGHPSRVP